VKALRKFLALDWTDRLMLLEALLYLGLSRAALLTIPFRQISRRLGKQFPPEAVLPPGEPAPPVALRVSWAIDVMSRRTPWESACLAQAMAGKFMLRRRGIPSRLSLGMKKDTGGQLSAHAWLQVGDAVLLGASREPFTTLSTFADPPAGGLAGRAL
jgi:hypothetical protein